MDVRGIVADVVKDKKIAGVVVDLIEEMLASANVGIEEITDILDTEKMSMEFLLKWFSFYGVDFNTAENGEIDRAAARRYRALLRKRGELEAIGSVIQSGGGMFVKEPIEAQLWLWDTVPKYVEPEPEDGFIYVRTSNPNIITDSPLIDKVTPAGYTYLTTIVKLIKEVLAILEDPQVWLNKYWERGVADQVIITGKWWEKRTHLPIYTRPALMDNQWQASGAQWEGTSITSLTQRLQSYLDQYFNIMHRIIVGHYMGIIDPGWTPRQCRNTSRERGLTATQRAELSRTGITNLLLTESRALSTPRWNHFIVTKEATTTTLFVREMATYLGQYIAIQPFRYINIQGDSIKDKIVIGRTMLRALPGRQVPVETEVTQQSRTREWTKPTRQEREKETRGTIASLTREGWTVARSTRKETHLSHEQTVLHKANKVYKNHLIDRSKTSWKCGSPAQDRAEVGKSTLSIKERRGTVPQPTITKNVWSATDKPVKGRLSIAETITYWYRTGTTVARALIQPSDTQIQTLAV